MEVLGQKMGDGKRVPKGVGAIIETPGFLPNCAGYQNLRYLMELSGKVDRERIRQAIAAVGLDPDSGKHVGKYSLGMRQRLGLAQAIMEDPELLILDEPMNGLDKGGVAEMRELFLLSGPVACPYGNGAAGASSFSRPEPCCPLHSSTFRCYMVWGRMPDGAPPDSYCLKNQPAAVERCEPSHVCRLIFWVPFVSGISQCFYGSALGDFTGAFYNEVVP